MDDLGLRLREFVEKLGTGTTSSNGSDQRQSRPFADATSGIAPPSCELPAVRGVIEADQRW